MDLFKKLQLYCFATLAKRINCELCIFRSLSYRIKLLSTGTCCELDWRRIYCCLNSQKVWFHVSDGLEFFLDLFVTLQGVANNDIYVFSSDFLKWLELKLLGSLFKNVLY